MKERDKLEKEWQRCAERGTVIVGKVIKYKEERIIGFMLSSIKLENISVSLKSA